MRKVPKVESINIQSVTKQPANSEQTHLVCLHAMEKFEKLESINTQNDYETKSKK